MTDVVFVDATGSLTVSINGGDAEVVTLGASGPQGISAYAVAVENGFVGTEAAWLASLVGAQGPAGAAGPQGPAGADGALNALPNALADAAGDIPVATAADTWGKLADSASTVVGTKATGSTVRLTAAEARTVLALGSAAQSATSDFAPASGINPSAVTGTAVVTGDARLSDARTPTAHQSSHLAAGSDPLTGISPSQVTGTAAILGANVHTAQQMIDGSADEIQQRVQGHSTQTAKLQTWENSAGAVVASVDVAGLVRMIDHVACTGVENYSTGLTCIAIAADRNVGLGTASGSYGGGKYVVFLANANTVPASDPTGGGILFAEGGALKWRGSSGTVTTIASA